MSGMSGAQLQQKWMERGSSALDLSKLEDLEKAVRGLSNGLRQLFDHLERERDSGNRQQTEVRKLAKRVDELEAQALRAKGSKK